MSERSEGRSAASADDFWRQDVLDAIADHRCTRDDVAVEYATALRAYGPNGDWAGINGAILGRWSMSGLRYIKEKAWKLATP